MSTDTNSPTITFVDASPGISANLERQQSPGMGAVNVVVPNHPNYPSPVQQYNYSVPAACGWYQAPDTAGGCQFSAVSVLQSVFGLPSKIVEPALLGLPGMLVPVVGLAVNVGAWWLVYKVVSKRVLGWKD